ncbi:MAG: TraR/DksA C4-type zinc finger protein [Fibromonadaceae bacterium]|jgi:RNA polymerase-binding protein DksA|nr:TraR/DksA C4-type zinc finger protein [Fibromonadaceae bacterium]
MYIVGVMENLNKNDLERFKELLTEKYKSSLEELRYRERAAMENQRETGAELSSYANHPAEAASDYANLTMNLNLAERDSKYIKQLGDALRRIEKGTFGICTVCKEPIPILRLEAVPTTTKCLDCKNEIKRQEQEDAKRGGTEN